MYFGEPQELVVDVTVLGLVGGAPGGETPRVADARTSDLAYRHTRNPRRNIYVCIYINIVYIYTGLGGWLLKTDLSD